MDEQISNEGLDILARMVKNLKKLELIQFTFKNFNENHLSKL